LVPLSTHVHRVQAGAGQRVQRLGGEPRVRVDLGGKRRDLRLRELAGRLAQQFVLFAKRVHQRCSW
jgi:hypothetical protein